MNRWHNLHRPERNAHHRMQYENNNIYRGSVDDNDNADSRESDLLWDDDEDEIPVEAFHDQNTHPLSSPSSLSSSDSEKEEALARHHHYRLNQEELSEDNSYEHVNGCNDTNSRTSSSSSFSNSANSSDDASNVLDGLAVVERIEDFILQVVIEPLSEEPNPSVPELDVQVDEIGFKRKLSFHHLSQARSLTSIILVASFCHNLLAPPITDRDDSEGEEEEENDGDGALHRQGCRRPIPLRKTTTTREVYYFYVTYFRDQRECDKAIWDLVRILNLPSRQCLGLVASPKGWFCGSIDVYNAQTNELKFNGRELDAHGMAITPSTYDNYYYRNGRQTIDCSVGDREMDGHGSNDIRIESDARCILVIEKEGVYTRLSEDKFFLTHFPCILVTGKGFPDIATRRWVWRMQRTLKIPVYGLCDCNPYGVSVLDTYMHHQGVKLSADENNQRHKKKKSKPRNGDEEEDSFDIRWIGLRPSQVESMGLPAEVFQELTSNDDKRLDSLLVPKSSRFKPFVEGGRDKAQRVSELEAMRKYKVELEALLWKGPDYLSRFVREAVMKEESQRSHRGEKVMQRRRRKQPDFHLSDDSDSVSDRHDDEIPDTIEW